MKTFFSVITTLFAVMFLCGPSAQSQQASKKKPVPLPADVQVTADIEFTRPGGHPLLLDLYRPTNTTTPVPVVVFVHGGGWKQGSRASGRKMAWLVPHGFAIASIDYRLTSEGQWPDQINDCYSAVRWVREHAAEYGCDGDRVGCWGTSAGGHLVALMGTRPCPEKEDTSSRVQAVCDWFGPTELLTMPPNNVGNGRTIKDVAKSNGALLLGATVRDVPELARDASALDHVTPDDAPFLIIHGGADPGVPVSQSEKLHKRLIASGVPSQLVVLPDAGHGGREFSEPHVRQAVAEFFARFLRRDVPRTD